MNTPTVITDTPKVTKTSDYTFAQGTFTLNGSDAVDFMVFEDNTTSEIVLTVPQWKLIHSSTKGYFPDSRKMGADLGAIITEEALASLDDLPVGYDTN